MGLIGGIAGGAHPWFAAKSEHLQSGIIGQDYFSGSVAAVELGFLDGISRESCAIFFNLWPSTSRMLLIARHFVCQGKQQTPCHSHFIEIKGLAETMRPRNSGRIFPSRGKNYAHPIRPEPAAPLDPSRRRAVATLRRRH